MITTSDDFHIEFTRDAYDVTSNHRPDTSWKFVDKAGHVHQWFDGGNPATNYLPTVEYTVPSVVWIKTGIAHYDDGSTYEVGDYHCIICGDVVELGHTADTVERHIAGDKINVSGHCVIDYNRGREFITSHDWIDLKDVLKDVDSYDLIVNDLPNVKVRVNRFKRTEDSVCQVWFQGGC